MTTPGDGDTLLEEDPFDRALKVIDRLEKKNEELEEDNERLLHFNEEAIQTIAECHDLKVRQWVQLLGSMGLAGLAAGWNAYSGADAIEPL